ncbi:EIF2B-5 domain-containing protein [Aphelenchoides fujianensis]|nr:EIF2B-5 domain-containing protein [Aphelenchoides fujianensis]
MAEEDLSLDLTAKKKKKKTKVTLDDAAKDGDQTEELVLPTKKKTKEIRLDEPEDVASSDVAPGIGQTNLIDAKQEWPDYTYEQLLELVFDIMRERNPDMVAGEKKKFVMKPPQVARAGSKKTAFTNFAEICRLLKRTPKHVLNFLLAELGTTGSIDGNQCLIVKGRFQQKHFESVLRKYIKEYVTCHTCRSSDTELTKDTRLFFLKCNVCNSQCSVTAIKSGFTAVVGKRAASTSASGRSSSTPIAVLPVFARLLRDREETPDVAALLALLERLVARVPPKSISRFRVSAYIGILESLICCTEDQELGAAPRLDLFEPTGRLLLVRRVFRRIANGELKVTYEPQVLAWIVDQYRRFLAADDSRVFRSELTFFYMDCAAVHYQEVELSYHFMVAVCLLAQFHAKLGFDLPLLKAAKERVLEPIFTQVSDFRTLTEMKKEDGAEEKAEKAGNLDFLLFALNDAMREINQRLSAK